MQQLRRYRSLGLQQRTQVLGCGPPATKLRPKPSHVRHASTWDKDTVKNFIIKELEANQTELGDAWKGTLPSSPDELYDEIDAAAKQWNSEVDMVMQLPKYKQADAYFQNVKVPAVLSNHVIGMGTWRLKATVDPVIQILVARIEGLMRTVLRSELNLYPPHTWKGSYDFLDSMDPTREWDNWAWADLPSPRKGMEGYPRLLIENRIYMSRAFRKLHIEVATRQDGIDILHIVLYPRYQYDLPILAIDMVIVNGNVTLAIVDACPVRLNGSLPPQYIQVMQQLQDNFLVDAENARKVPDWGEDILSSMCVLIRPTSPEELVGFLKYTIALANAHLKLSLLTGPVEGENTKASALKNEIKACHKRFCERNLENKKTSRVLEQAFGAEYTRGYMEKVMFDYNPSDDPEWVDGGLSDFISHMEKNPVKDPLWEQELMVERINHQAEVAEQMEQLGAVEQRLNEIIDSLEGKATGLTTEISQFLLENDPEFRDILFKLFRGMRDYDEQEERMALVNAKKAYLSAYKKWYVP